MVYKIELFCEGKNSLFTATYDPMLLPDSMIEIRDGMQYPTDFGFRYATRDYINKGDDIIKAARKENWRMRFIPKDKLHTYMLLYLFSEDKGGKVLVYYYNFTTKKTLELYTIDTDWFTRPSEDAWPYPCLSYILESVFGIKSK
jgi:hypothetical protein